MSRVKRKDTKPEVLVRKFLFSQGFRYRVNYKKLPGSPDIVLPKYKTAIFVHGCFWHGHECRAGGKPKSNRSYWNEKLEKNKERDQRKYRELEELGWLVLVVWECEVKNKEMRQDRLSRLLGEITER